MQREIVVTPPATPPPRRHETATFPTVHHRRYPRNPRFKGPGVRDVLGGLPIREIRGSHSDLASLASLAVSSVPKKWPGNPLPSWLASCNVRTFIKSCVHILPQPSHPPKVRRSAPFPSMSTTPKSPVDLPAGSAHGRAYGVRPSRSQKDPRRSGTFCTKNLGPAGRMQNAEVGRRLSAIGSQPEQAAASARRNGRPGHTSSSTPVLSPTRSAWTPIRSSIAM
jgi:hypothetical protein